ncbi:hypothetical protein HS041_11640 [Planomonospora sp. ID67723]|uniref:hypothetical protein n=1 Tax=Planomonospora sp. ID67723 TaxID=2738134 RepID=UPI0018C41900|nr:hypothetical protein [Planomonospora sp. ID67723]MBG0828418.1 hypothetical protein [Planomonospora sp. ID67723]
MDSLTPAGGARSQDRAEDDRRVRPEGPPTGRWRRPLLGADGSERATVEFTPLDVHRRADARAAWILDANLHEVLRYNGLPCDAGRLRGLCAGPV